MKTRIIKTYRYHLCVFLFLCVTALPIAGSGNTGTGESENLRSARNHNRAGLALLKKGEYAGAESLFLRALELNPENKLYYNNAAASMMNQGAYSRAVIYLNRALEIDPGFVKALSNMAISRFHLSEYRLAYHYYRRARRADSGYTENRFMLAKVITGMEKLQKDNPDDENLKQILRKVRKLDKAP